MTFWLAFALLCSLSLNVGLIVLLFRSRRHGSVPADGWTTTCECPCRMTEHLWLEHYSTAMPEARELGELVALTALHDESGRLRSTPTSVTVSLRTPQ